MNNKFDYKEVKTPFEMGKEEFNKFIDSLSDEDYDAYREALNLRTMHKALDLLNTGVSTLVNDHNGQVEQIDAYVILSSGYVCPVYINTVCCLNYLYVGHDGNIHLSTSSIAGNFYTNFKTLPSDCSKNDRVAAGVEQYNKTQTDANAKYDLHYATITDYTVIDN